MRGIALPRRCRASIMMKQTLAERAAFLPKLVTTLSEGYGTPQLRADLLAGLTVAIVALPLSMAIAIASGVPPERGLYTAIVGGFLVSALGGSRFQIGGPAGAFIVLVAATVQAHGIDGLVLATMLSGLMLVAAGLLRLGSFVKFIPYPVTVGFTAGIAAILFASQIVLLLGLTLAGPEPGPLVEKLSAIWTALPTVNPATVALSLASVAALLLLQRLRPHWPRMLIVVTLASLAAWALGVDVATIGSAFGGIPPGFPAPALPPMSLERVIAVLPNAFSFTLLGSIESLLSAVVADGMTGRRHRSNTELVAQGIANVGAGLFGGFCVTGTIARTATNVRAGAHGPVAGMAHALFLLVFVLVAAPLAAYVPLAALAAVLAVVAWDMVEKPAFAALLRASWGDATVLLVTLGLTLFRDLTEAIVVGFALGAVLFIHRMAGAVAVEEAKRAAYRPEDGADPQAVIFRVTGAMFFGAVSAVGAALDRIGDEHRVLVIDFGGVTLVDSSAANMIEGLAAKARRRGVAVYLAGADPGLRRDLLAHGARPPLVRYAPTIESALAAARRRGELAAPTVPGAAPPGRR
jgi:SulP family sulfate permease